MRVHPSTPPGQFSASKEPSEGLSTPTSSTFSNGASSPGYGSSFGSPVSSHSRVSGFWGGGDYHGRRLSVPSGPNPFQSPQNAGYQPAYFSPLAPSNASIMSNNSSALASPTSSNYSFSRRESMLAAEAEWRRRTWHPSTYNNHPRPATSGLSYYQTPDDAPRPAFAQQAATATSVPLSSQRLPGIEAFDQMTTRQSSDPHRSGSPMQVDSPSKPPVYPGPAVPSTSGPNDRRGHASWDMSLHKNLTKLDIASGTPPTENGAWSQQQTSDIQSTSSMPPDGPAPQNSLHPQPPIVVHQEQQKRSYESSQPKQQTPYKAKRQAWYIGPSATSQTTAQLRTSPEGSSSSESVPTPLHSAPEYHPSIVSSDGQIEGHQPVLANVSVQSRVNVRLQDDGSLFTQNYNQNTQPHPYPYYPNSHVISGTQVLPHKGNGMSSLEVLVAVATNEGKAATGGS
ncbi:MAG: hypothetical protein Q9190_007417 [Brigantiaea leucoxantha]